MVKMKNAGGGAQPGRTNRLTDTNLLLAITVVVFLVMYIGAMLFLKELVSNYLILCHPEEIFSKVSEDMLTETDFEEDSFSQYYTGKKSEKEKSRPA